jgi:hypothetical protein
MKPGEIICTAKIDEAEYLGNLFENMRSGKEIYSDVDVTTFDAKPNLRQLKARASTKNAVRGMAILPNAWDLNRYRKNPVILWMHNILVDLPPIAKALWTKTDDEGLLQLVQFAKTDFAEEIYQLYVDEFLKAWSVGWAALGYLQKGAEGFTDVIKQFKIKGDPEYIVTKAKLYEVSAVTVPADEDALVLRSFRSEDAKNIIINTLKTQGPATVEEEQTDLQRAIAEEPEDDPVTETEEPTQENERSVDQVICQNTEILMLLQGLRDELAQLRSELENEKRKPVVTAASQPVVCSAEQLGAITRDVLCGEMNKLRGKLDS